MDVSCLRKQTQEKLMYEADMSVIFPYIKSVWGRTRSGDILRRPSISSMSTETGSLSGPEA